MKFNDFIGYLSIIILVELIILKFAERMVYISTKKRYLKTFWNSVSQFEYQYRAFFEIIDKDMDYIQINEFLAKKLELTNEFLDLPVPIIVFGYTIECHDMQDCRVVLRHFGEKILLYQDVIEENYPDIKITSESEQYDTFLNDLRNLRIVSIDLGD